MDSTGCDSPVVTSAELLRANRAAVVFKGQEEPPGEDVDRFVLDLVSLERQAAPGLDDEDLADVAIGLSPDELVAPGLVALAAPGSAPGLRLRS